MKLEKRQNPSSKMLMGLAAVGATGSASGALVQIDLIGNTITAGGGNQLSTDLTGDMSADVVFARSGYNTNPPGRSGVNSGVIAFPNSPSNIYAQGYSRTFAFAYRGQVGSNTVRGQGLSTSGLIAITFDATSLGFSSNVAGVINVSAGAIGGDIGVSLNSLVFDDGNGMPVTTATDISGAQVIGSVENGAFTAVPEPSSLALLALGAAGVVTRRQRKKAA